MDDLIDDIEFAVEHQRWLIALAGTLALPDICAALQSDDGETTGRRYRSWVRSNVGEAYPNLDPHELYKMRCSFLHQGSSSAAQYAKVMFLGPESPVGIHHMVIRNEDINETVLIMDLPTFCADMITAVRAWRNEAERTANYQRNVEALMRWRHGGVLPYVEGVRVLT